MKSADRYLFSPVNSSSLALFRILFGFIMAVNIFVYYPPSIIEERFVQPTFFFSYPLFNWLHLKPWADIGMHLHFFAMGTAAVFIGLGLLYRFFSILFFVLFLYMFQLDKAYSPIPHYLYTLIAGLLLFMNPHHLWSFDRIFQKKQINPEIPFWQIFLLRFQVTTAYFFSGLGKITHPDWLAARQMRIWLGELKDVPVIGYFCVQDWVIYLFSFGGIIFDLTIGFLLWNRKTRALGFVLVLFFHLWNKFMLGIQIFPWFMIITLVVFLDPDQPQKFFSKICSIFKSITDREPPLKQKFGPSKVIKTLIALYIFIQLAIPLRHFLYPCDVNWTHLGQYFSWHFMNNNMWGKITINFSTPKGY